MCIRTDLKPWFSALTSMTDFYQEKKLHLLETLLKYARKVIQMFGSPLWANIFHKNKSFKYFYGSFGKDEVTVRATVCLSLFYIKIHGWYVDYLKCLTGCRFCLTWNALWGWSYVSVPSRYWPSVFEENHEKTCQYSQILMNCIILERNWAHKHLHSSYRECFDVSNSWLLM
jgi:hypothetical protein